MYDEVSSKSEYERNNKRKDETDSGVNDKCIQDVKNTSTFVTKNTLIGEAVQEFPEIAEVLLSYGLHCIGCHVSPHETIEQGAKGHGMSDEQIFEMMRDANKFIALTKENEEQTQKPEKEIRVTDAAVTKVIELLKKEKKEGHVLRIRVISGGCAGSSYQFLVEEHEKSNDFIVEKNGLKVVFDPKSVKVLQGCTINYVETLNESGFKIDNPNATKKCGCGSSFS